MVYAKNLLSFWQLGIWYVLGRGYLCDPSSVKTLSTESVMSSLVESISYMLSQSVAGGIKHLLCESTGRGLLEACFLQTLPYTPFPFVDFALYPVYVIVLSMTISWVLWVLLANRWTWGDLEEPWHIFAFRLLKKEYLTDNPLLGPYYGLASGYLFILNSYHSSTPCSSYALLFLKHSRHAPASRPLYLLFPLPVPFLPDICMAVFIHVLPT